MHPKALRQAKSIENVYNSAYWHLSRQDYTTAEIKTKLQRKTDNTEWIEAVLTDLIDKGYIKSDVDFAIRFAETAFSNQIGPSAIKRKLLSRGITEKAVYDAVEQVMTEFSIDPFELAASRLKNSFHNFNSTTKEKLYSQLTSKGFSRDEIAHAIATHPEKNTLRNKLEVKAEKADLSTEIIKLYRKGKGKNLILRELRSRLIDVDCFDETVSELEQREEIDFYQCCYETLSKKRFDISSNPEKSKAYAYLSRKGFSADEIKEAFDWSESAKQGGSI